MITKNSNQKEKIRRLPNSTKHGPLDVTREDPIAQNSVYRSTKQPISVSSLSKSVNTTQMLPEYITNQNQLIHESGSFTHKKHIADETNKRSGKHLILKTSSKLNTPSYTRRKTSLEEESRINIDSEKIRKCDVVPCSPRYPHETVSRKGNGYFYPWFFFAG